MLAFTEPCILKAQDLADASEGQRPSIVCMQMLPNVAPVCRVGSKLCPSELRSAPIEAF